MPYGAQTLVTLVTLGFRFESCVMPYGAQTGGQGIAEI